MGLLERTSLASYSSFGYNSSCGISNNSYYSFGSYGYTKPVLFNFGGYNKTYTPTYSFRLPSISTNYKFNDSYSDYSSFAPPSDAFSKSSVSNPKFGSLTITRSTGSLQKDLVNNALSWVGKVNSDATGNRLFSSGINQPWCADFVTYNTKKTFGSKLPSSFGSSSVYGLMNWGKENNCYLDLTASSNKADYIASNVKPGDIMIEKRGGKSHTGIVTKVNSDGSFETVEGNTSNKVATRRYTANSSTLSGFVSLDRYAA